MALFPYKDGFPSGALVSGECYKTHTIGAGGSIIYLNVDEITGMLARIEQHGGKAISPCLELDGGNGFVATFRDSEGNVVGLWAPKA